MSKIKSFNRPALKSLRVSLDAALAKVAAEHGISISAGNISFTAETATIKLNAGVIGSGGVAVTKEAQAFDQYKNLVGLGSLNVGDVIDIQGSKYTISGYKPRSKRSPVCITNSAGKGYKVSVEMVKQYNALTA
jgi:hypothetical protein|tara:strand:- start:3938 stop:4339 length:402 start_codon:yes stop_codon:yes gene_type:complete